MAGQSLPLVKIQNLGGAQTNVPFTFGQVFAPGDLMPTEGLAGGALALQVDVKATHADGSVRHAIISGVMPALVAGATTTLQFSKASQKAANVKSSALNPLQGTVSNLSRVGFSASFHAKIKGEDWYVSADDLLKVSAPATWLKGPIVTEWQVFASLRNAAGALHPHLAARFAVRWYESIRKARVDLTIENGWTFEPDPQNFVYDAEIQVGGVSIYSKAGLNHLHHARWRKIFWFGDEPAINVQHDVAYLIGTGAVPNYDQSLVIDAPAMAPFKDRWKTSGQEPMDVGLMMAYMPTTGAHDDIGLLPAWQASYLLSQDAGMKEIMLRTAELAGSFGSHYRDKNTGRPVSLEDYPYMTVNGRSGDTGNPVTGKYEFFPACAPGGDCSTPYTHDGAHQPSIAYLPYLVTGDYFYLEELQFWGMWYAYETNPGYRGNIKGIMSSEQVRGQAWALRTLADAAYITPDTDSLKGAFNRIINNNLDWYTDTYITKPDPAYANQLGIITNGYAIEYYGNTGIAPWQDDFFTSAIGAAAEKGFEKAIALLKWKVKFPTARMTEACWIDAAIYGLIVRDTSTSPFYTTYAQAYAKSHDAKFLALPCGGDEMAAALGLRPGEMTGYAPVVTGYPANMQPALAYAADFGGDSGKKAWAIFAGRKFQPDYRFGPQFAIVPRNKVEPAVAPVPVPPAPPAPAKPPVLKTPSNVLLKKLANLTVKVVDPKTISLVAKFEGITAASTGVISVSSADLTAKSAYAVVVEGKDGNVIDIMFPVIAN